MVIDILVQVHVTPDPDEWRRTEIAKMVRNAVSRMLDDLPSAYPLTHIEESVTVRAVEVTQEVEE